MTPTITKQMKLLIRDKKSENINKNSSKFEIMTDPLPTVCLLNLIFTLLFKFN